MVPKKHRAGEDGAITNPNQQKPVRHIGLKRKHQLEGPVPKSKENGAVTNSRIKCKNPQICPRRRAHQPIIYTNPSFVRRCDHLPATPQRKSPGHFHKKDQNQEGKVARNTHTRMGGELLHQPLFKNTHLFFEMHTHTFFEMHTIIGTNGAAANYELGRR